MSGFWKFRRLLAGAVLASVAGGSFVLAQSGASSPASPPPATRPAVAPGSGIASPDSAIATINGRDVNNKVFYDTLMQVAGMRIWDHLFNLSLVQAECATNGLEFSGKSFDERFQAEVDKLIDSITSSKPEEKLTREQKIQLLNETLAQRGVTGTEFNIDVQTRTNLRALSKGRVDVSDSDVKETYMAENGERREVRIIYIADLAKQGEFRKALGEKKNIDTVATDLKIPMQSNVIISTNAKGIDDAKKWIFSAKEKDLSSELEVPSQSGTQKVLIYVDKIMPDKTKEIPLTPKLTDELRQKVKDFKENQWMNTHLILLRGNATVKINDPFLADQFQQLDKNLKAQAAAANTQPGSGSDVIATPPTSGPAPSGATGAPSAPAGGAPAIAPTLPPAGRGR